MKKSLLIFLFLLAVSAICVFIAQSTSEIAYATDVAEEEEEPLENEGLPPDDVSEGLFDGAFAEWSADGSAESINGENPLTVLLIHGAENVDFTAQVDFRARFGPFGLETKPITITVPTGEEVAIPLNANFAYSIHAKQAHYPTNLYAEVTVLLEDGSFGRRQMLPIRFLVFNDKNGKAEIYDGDALHSAFPLRITSQEEQQRVENIMSKKEDGFIDLGVLPGIPRTEPLSVAEKIPGEDE